MQKGKGAQWIGMLLQGLLILLFFMYAGTEVNSGTPLNSVQMGVLYLKRGGFLHVLGGVLYGALLFVLPVAVWLVALLCRPRINFAICVVLCTVEAMSSSCFYTMMEHRMAVAVNLNHLYYRIVAVELLSLLVFIYAYLKAWDGKK